MLEVGKLGDEHVVDQGGQSLANVDELRSLLDDRARLVETEPESGALRRVAVLVEAERRKSRQQQ